MLAELYKIILRSTPKWLIIIYRCYKVTSGSEFRLCKNNEVQQKIIVSFVSRCQDVLNEYAPLERKLVEVLSLSVNRITSLKQFAACPSLEELYLRKNEIADLSEVPPIS